MVENKALNEIIQELVDRAWDTESINAWFERLNAEGIPRKTLLKGEIVSGKKEILDRVQRKAEECEFLSHS